MDRNGLGCATKPSRTNYDLAHSTDSLKKMLEEIGFINVKIWFQPVNFVFNNFDDFFATLFNQPSTAAKLASLPEDKLQALMEDIRKEYKECIEDAVEPAHFENMIIIAQKP